MKQRSLKVNFILNIIKTCSSVLFPLITYPYISRVLQPINIGKINFGSSFVSYFSLIASLGISTYAIRECSKKREDRKELSCIASQIFSINIHTTIIAYILLAISLIFFRRLDSYRTLIIIQSTVILFTTVGVDWVNTAMEDFTYITIRTIGFQLLSLVLMFVLVKSPDDYVKYATISVVSSSGANFLNVFYVKKYCDIKFTNSIDWKLHLKPILLLFVMLLAQQIFNNIDITMLGLLKGDYEVGLYSTAVKVTNVINQVSASLVWVLLPQLSLNFSNDNYDQINNLLRKAFNAILTIGLPCGIGVICLSKQIVLLIGGVSYIGAQMSLVFLMAYLIVSIFGGSFLGNMALLPNNGEKQFMEICIFMAVFDAVANYFLIPPYGATGAALATMLSALVTIPMYIKARDKRIKLKELKEVLPAPFIGSIFIAIVCFIVNNIIFSTIISTLVSIVFSVIIYFIVQLWLKNELILNLIKLLKFKLKGNN